MAIVKFSYGKPQRNSVAGVVHKKDNKLNQLTYNQQACCANPQQFSSSIPTRYPKEEGKLCTNVFGEEPNSKELVLTKAKNK